MPSCLPVFGINCTSLSVQQNSLRGQRLKLSSLGGSKTCVSVDETGSPVRLDSELSSTQEVAEDSNKVKSKGGEVEEEESVGRVAGEDEGNDQRDGKVEERCEGSVQVETEDDAKVKEECCGGGEEENIEGVGESENLSERDRNSSNIEVEEQNDERNDNEESVNRRSKEDRKERTDSEEEMVEVDGVKEGSESDEGSKRCSLSNEELKQCDEGGVARSLKTEGGETEGNESELDEEAAALKPQTAQECDSCDTGAAGIHPAEADHKSDLRMDDQKRESLTGSLTAEVRFNVCVCVCSHPPHLLDTPPPCMQPRLPPAFEAVAARASPFTRCNLSC